MQERRCWILPPALLSKRRLQIFKQRSLSHQRTPVGCLIVSDVAWMNLFHSQRFYSRLYTYILYHLSWKFFKQKPEHLSSRDSSSDFHHCCNFLCHPPRKSVIFISKDYSSGFTDILAYDICYYPHTHHFFSRSLLKSTIKTYKLFFSLRF